MDRARRIGVARAGGRAPAGRGGNGRRLNPRHAARAAWVLPALVFACTGISSGTDPVAIEFVAPPASIAVGDTVPLHIRALDRSGDSVPGAVISLIALNPDTLGVDSVLRAVIGVAPGPNGRVVAMTGNLVSDPLRITVNAP